MKRNYLNQIRDRMDPGKIIIFGLALALLLTFFSALFTNGESFFLLFHSDPNDTFMDFFNSIYDASAYENPYLEGNVIYPPLTYLFYRFCSRFMNHELLHPIEWRNNQQGLLVYLAITFLTVAVLYRVMNHKDHDKNGSSLLPALLLFGTVPFWYTYERGNLILQAFLLLAFFVLFYDSEKPVLRELALISLAISSSLKIYPALFGLLLLRDKKFGAAARCVLYGLIAFFAPFLFYGGLQSAQAMIENIAHTSGKFGGLGFGYKVNLLNTLDFISQLIPFPRHTRTVVFLFIGCCILAVLLFSKEKWQFLTGIALAVILFPGFSYTYTLIFMALPLWEFYHHCDKNKKLNWVVAVLFVLIFCPIPFGGRNPFHLADSYYELGLTTAVSSISLIILTVVLTFDCIISRFHKARFSCSN